MLHLARKLRGATVRAVDGDVGTLEDFYFEEGRWTIRYLLVDTGTWMSGRRVLISPMSVFEEWDITTIPLRLSSDQVWNSPRFNPERSLSRSDETQLLGYFGYPYYWGYSSVWGSYDNPGALIAAPPAMLSSDETQGIDPEARHLKSVDTTTGSHVCATDGEIGHVDDFLIGQETWRIRYLLIDTSNWIGGRSVLVSSDALEGVDTERGEFRVNATRDAIAHGPSFASIEAALDTRETGPPFTFI